MASPPDGDWSCVLDRFDLYYFAIFANTTNLKKMCCRQTNGSERTDTPDAWRPAKQSKYQMAHSASRKQLFSSKLPRLIVQFPDLPFDHNVEGKRGNLFRTRNGCSGLYRTPRSPPVSRVPFFKCNPGQIKLISKIGSLKDCQNSRKIENADGQLNKIPNHTICSK
jgi:hypothetical protein